MSSEINPHFYHQLISMRKIMFFSKLTDEILSTIQKNRTKILDSFTKLTEKKINSKWTRNVTTGLETESTKRICSKESSESCLDNDFLFSSKNM